MKTSRNTNAKAIILEIITNSDVALSHAELQTLANGACDRVTIYRILDRLVNEDLIHKAVDLDGTVKYARCYHAEHNHLHNHVHFSCEKCHLVTCLDTIEPTFILPKDYLIKEMNFILSGLCPNCK